MNAHALSAELVASMRPQMPSDLGALTARAYAAAVRLHDTYREGTEAEIDAAEKLSDLAHRQVRAKLAEMGVDPAMLRAVI